MKKILRWPALFLVLSASSQACGGSDHRRTQADASSPPTPDSAGWRFARVAQGRLALRYPTALMAGTVDQSELGCARPLSGALVEDTTLTDRLVVLTTALPLADIAKGLGFVRQMDGWWLDPVEPTGWTGGVQAESLAVNGWAALFGEVSTKVMPDVDTSLTGDDRVTPVDAHQSRFVAGRTLGTRCTLVLVWWGGEYLETDSTAHPEARPAALAHLLEGANIRPQ